MRRELGALRAQLLDLGFEDGDLGAAPRRHRDAITDSLIADIAGGALPDLFRTLGKDPIFFGGEPDLQADTMPVGHVARHRGVGWSVAFAMRHRRIRHW